MEIGALIMRSLEAFLGDSNCRGKSLLYELNIAHKKISAQQWHLLFGIQRTLLHQNNCQRT